MKPGIKTTEFWTWVITMLSSTVTAAFTIYYNQGRDPVVEVVVYIVKAVIDLITTAFYIWARAKIKVANSDQRKHAFLPVDPLLCHSNPALKMEQ